MHCKFLKHGLSISYDHVVKPCCMWNYDRSYAQSNQVGAIDIVSWHETNAALADSLQKLEQGTWPNSCNHCESMEQQGRGDSIRGCGNSAYGHYQNNDIVLEIRPGNVCNFACQTCWPAASSRVSSFYHAAGMIDIKNVNSAAITNFDFLLPVADRIKNIVLMGGEPFYDRHCRNFIQWATQHLPRPLTLITNGSTVDWQMIDDYPAPIIMVFSLDAVGRSAEYVRYGTVWQEVLDNFQRCKTVEKIELRVNICLSIYNYHLVADVIDLLLPEWPAVVSYTHPRESWLKVQAIPEIFRPHIVKRLQTAIDRVSAANIDSGQQATSVNAFKSIIYECDNLACVPDTFRKWQEFVQSMDQVKRIDVKDHCDFLWQMSQYDIS